ncbi:tRNA (adenosine(37)-N6)-threonylcarbamoyltransferase complex ATPase subunit type 1 TsaE [Candidatus Daviesbacteria bacterium RIFCSPHIGHO2_01_FULL_40_11]|uniref:tRNA threonylcarbamoyladenosine biosynthesis protein TsaE n=1 Tax=Candidatus Daviesbacteria bacterium RIFCSPHIGHO2_01_FULL_40_11 TaxID=1797762 RepID=A0A1F5JI10_9BACT|nr:MAG: tRNA (adenosine(37)-N6)-threonylcarbamoyltransferase complex ATPase subunit type 1 TsaE [Candidatus Daviesbacteria bacterium RIFCSPHIGHO2_01_FULL_40_11]OGE63090.1 MAG: tRNA (adenosine(37)-N6)-threonylcarbamoyltransferase complex ATPase subunit type 1 TsaE [Candidatus Daviesbacteria bacterium RIFCSPLOWO2_01_FULL_40_27]
MAKYLSSSEKQTQQIARQLAKMVRQAHHKRKVFALTGELGAGKTIFVQGFAKGLGIKDKIISPTFILIRQHKIPDTTQTLYHIDLYRLEDTKDFRHMGLKEILSDPNNIVLIEWAEKAKELLPKNTVKINISKGDDQNRVIAIS